MSYWIAGATVASAVIGGAASMSGAAAGEEAAARAEASNRIAGRQQNALTQQSLELNRPVIQTRDAALNQLNAFFGLPQVAPSRTGFGSGAEGVIPLPGVTTRQDGQVEGGKDIRQTVYFDPGQNAIVDDSGSIIERVPAGGGTLQSVVHGRNNAVAVDAQGNLTSVGSSGSNPLGVQLVRGQPQQQQPAGQPASGAGPDFSNILNLPIFSFQRQQGEGVINRNLANRGKFFSGQRGAALLNFNNALVANRINEDYVQPRLTLAGYGQQSAGNAQNALANFGSSIGQTSRNTANNLGNAANSRASGYAGAADSLNQGIGNLLVGQYLRQDGQTTQPTQRNSMNYYGSRTPYGNY